ncbi:hypothetical protein [Streptomyces sp. NPDC051211]|uniref:hypothetical protein n=1 Tax=Streptomyces sp. NPDC051211 TaxID=3154643 RepID=UPI00344F084D
MKNIARIVATAALVGAAVLTAGGVASADDAPQIGWPVAPPTAPAVPGADPAVADSTNDIGWP